VLEIEISGVFKIFLETNHETYMRTEYIYKSQVSSDLSLMYLPFVHSKLRPIPYFFVKRCSDDKS